jgi:hypothetical protein
MIPLALAFVHACKVSSSSAARDWLAVVMF